MPDSHDLIAADHHQQNLEPFFSLNRMGDICRHDQHLVRMHGLRFTTNSFFRFTIQNLQNGIERRRMLTEPLALIGSEL